MNLELLAIINAERAARRPVVVVTDIASGEQRLVLEQDLRRDPLSALLQEHLVRRKSGLVEESGRQIFLDVHVPPIKLFVVGAVHVSQALAPMAMGLDLDTTVIDPRTAFATPERFPEISLLAEWPDEVLDRLGLDRFTAVLTLTHDPKIDDQALSAALRSDCFYIGALGSRKSHAKRLERLTGFGFDERDLARIHAPVGLNIGAVSPAEIAISILAEIIAVIREDRRQARQVVAE